MSSTIAAYKEKMKELSMLSLICSCFYTQPHPNTINKFDEIQRGNRPLRPNKETGAPGENSHRQGRMYKLLTDSSGNYSKVQSFKDMEVKSINKRASGQAFEVILKPQSTDLSPEQPITPKKKDISLEKLQNQLDAAEDRRKTQEMQLLQQLAEKQQHRRIVLHRAIVDNCNFISTTERKLNQKMEACNENRKAHIAALKDRLREKERHAAEVRRNKLLREELSG
ncbi:stathmin-3-like isoform X1 [Hemitrygon akajei]|uniref:stathmin-3-like isoform X1 n=1 Tax=Hemitrygon akajei TaxID=2704970 RepID=UPI003BF98C8B